MDIINLILGIITYPIRWIWNWFVSPKPELLFVPLSAEESENNYCHLRRNTTFNNAYSWFFRIGVENKGSQFIKNADVRLERIETFINNNWQLLSDTPFFLHWANENTDNSRNIYKDTPVYLDVIFTICGFNSVFIFHKGKHSGAGITSQLPKGSYKFIIKLLGEDITPLKKELFIKFDGNWGNLKMGWSEEDIKIIEEKYVN